ncbi:hypothetical protein RRG08_064442 [Elysia crispata]|uniref:Uncharacterized protein n=1 Tax=Elysia crispata TaxID=231223 RepID=A0AAE1D714_9GAST|nr:hypothetical protein RRG08_064442 [Elysia crispata]
MIVSYKILEPEVFRNKENAIGGDKTFKDQFETNYGVQDKDKQDNDEPENKGNQLNGDNPELGTTDDTKEELQQHVDVDEVVKSMAKRFSLNFSYPLDTSPWRLAASWVTPRQIHPENAKELDAPTQSMMIVSWIVVEVKVSNSLGFTVPFNNRKLSAFRISPKIRFENHRQGQRTHSEGAELELELESLLEPLCLRLLRPPSLALEALEVFLFGADVSAKRSGVPVTGRSQRLRDILFPFDASKAGILLKRGYFEKEGQQSPAYSKTILDKMEGQTVPALEG